MSIFDDYRKQNEEEKQKNSGSNLFSEYRKENNSRELFKKKGIAENNDSANTRIRTSDMFRKYKENAIKQRDYRIAEEEYMASLPNDAYRNAYIRSKETDGMYVSPYYTKGIEGKEKLTYNNDEWNALSEGERKGYLEWAQEELEKESKKKKPNLERDNKYLNYAMSILNETDQTVQTIGDTHNLSSKVFKAFIPDRLENALGMNDSKKTADTFNKDEEMTIMLQMMPENVRKLLLGGWDLSENSNERNYLRQYYSDEMIDKLTAYAHKVGNIWEQQERNEAEEERMKNPLYATVVAPAKQIGTDLLIKPVAGSIDFVRSAQEMNKGLYGEYDPLESEWQKMAQDARYINESINSGLGPAGRFTYGTAVSAAESTARMYLAGGLAKTMPFLNTETASKVLLTGMMSTAVFNDDLNENIQKGMPLEDAIGSAVAHSVFESLFEEVSLDKLGYFQDAPVLRSKKEFVKALGKAALVEGSEEAFTDIANELYDHYVGNYDFSEYKAFKDKYLASNPDASDAEVWWNFTKQFSWQVAQSFAGGALSSFALSSTKNMSALQRGEVYVQNGKNVSDADYNRMNTFVEEMAAVNPNIANQLAEANEGGEDARRGFVKMVADEYSNKFNKEIARADSKDKLNVVMNNVNSVMNGAISEDTFNTYNAKLVELGETPADYNTFVQNRQRGGETTFSDLAYGRGDNAIQRNIVEASKSIAETRENAKLSESERETAIKGYAEKVEQNVKKAEDMVARYAQMGKALDSPEVRQFESVLGLENMAQIYSAGKIASENKMLPSLTGKGSGKLFAVDKNSEGARAIFGENIDHIQDVPFNELQKTTAYSLGKVLAKMTGVDVAFYKSDRQKVQNGAFHRNSNTIYIDVNAGVSGADAAVGEVFSHELTHWIRSKNEEGYQRLLDFVKADLGDSYDSMLKDHMDRLGLDEDVAGEEIVAEACQRMLKDSETFKRYASADMEGAKTLLQRLVDFVRKLRDAFKGSLNNEATRMIQNLEGLQQAWETALQEAIGETSERAAEGILENKPSVAEEIVGADVVTKDSVKSSQRLNDQLQEDKKKKNWTSENKKAISPVDHGNDYKTYKKLLNDNNLEARFSEYEDNPNYMKLVNETRMSYEDMAPVHPTFEQDVIMRELNRIKDEGQYGLMPGFKTKAEQDAFIENQNLVGQAVDAIGEWNESGKKPIDDTKYSSRGTERSIEEINADYMKAYESGDERSMQRYVEEAARRAGYDSPKVYHGTRFFGWTQYKDDSHNTPFIYTSTDSSVSANYAGDNHYAGIRKIGKAFKHSNDINDIIQNAESVYDTKYHIATNKERQTVYDEVVKEASEIADKLNTFDVTFDFDDELANAMARIESAFWTVQSFNDEWGNKWNDNRQTKLDLLKSDLRSHEEDREKLRNWYGEHRNELSTEQKKLMSYLLSYEVGDALIDMEYSLEKALYDGQIIASDVRGFYSAVSVDFAIPSEIQDAMEQIHNIGSYQLYGDLGDNPLEFDANGAQFWALKVPQMGDDEYHDTDAVSKWAAENGYTSVIMHNIYDYGNKADNYVFFSSNQLKSADPVTYDDNGNVIPLSERFNKESEDIRYSSRDSSGRELTEAQQEYFKDSKVRDEDGNLMVVYHGTTEKFFTFKDMPSRNGRVYGDGFYFTPDKKSAQAWTSNKGNGGKVKTVYLNITNPYYVGESYPAPQSLRDYLRDKEIEFHKTRMEQDGANSWWGSKLTAEEYAKRLVPDDMNSEAAFFAIEDDYKKGGHRTEVLKELGYDGVAVLLNQKWHSDKYQEFVAFYPEQIKSINAKTPTENPDIRYSTRDSEGHELSEGQQEYFKDSKVRDESGNLQVVYHGTDAEQDAFIENQNLVGQAVDAIGEWNETGKKPIDDTYNKIASAYGMQHMKERIQRKVLSHQLSRIEKYKEPKSVSDAVPMTAANEVDSSNGNIPQSSTNVNPRDEEYLKAVDSNDEATQARIIAEVAEENGYNTTPLYHQTGEAFTEFNTNNPQAGANDSETPNGIFLKTNDHDIGVGGDYVKTGRGGDIQMKLFIKAENMLHFKNRTEAAEWYKKNIDGYKETTDEWEQIYAEKYQPRFDELEKEQFNPDTTDERYAELDEIENALLAELKEEEDAYRGYMRDILNEYFLNGNSEYDGIELEDDGHRWINGKREEVHTFIVFNPSQVKSAENVVRDNNGDIIPPSQRFNDEKTDIRYSLRDLANSESEILVNALKNDATLVDQFGARKSVEAYAKAYGELKEMENQAIEYAKQLKKGTSPSEREAILRKQVRLDRAILNKTTELTEMRNQRVIRDLLIDEWEKRDEMIAIGRAEERYQTRKVLEDKYGEELKALRAKSKAKQTEIRNRFEINKRKKNIETKAKALMKMILNPTEKKHIPSVLVNPITDLLDSIDYWTPAEGRPTTKKSESLRTRFEDFRSAINEYQKQIDDGAEQIELMFDPEFLETVDDLCNSVKGIDNVNDMSVQDIIDLDHTLTELLHLISRGNKMIKAYHYETIKDAVDATAETMDKLDTLSSKTSAKGNLRMRLNAGMADSYAFGRYAGDGTKQIIDSLSKAFEEKISKVKQAIEFTQEVIAPYKKDLKKWSKDTHEFTLSTTDEKGNPNKVSLTVGQMMELYLLNKREQARGHIYGGGIRVEDRKGRYTESVKVTEEDVQEIVNYLSTVPGAIEVADKLQKYGATTITGWGNEASNLMYGFAKFTEPDYWQIRSDSSALKDNENTEAALNASMYRLQNMGRTKAVKKGANNAIYVGDVFDTWSKTIDEMTSYASILPSTTDAMRWWNSRIVNESGDAVRIKKLLESKLGTDMTRVFTETIKALNGGIMGTDSLESLVKVLTGKAKAAAVAGNLRVVLQQPTAYTRAAAVIEPKYLLKALSMKPNANEAQEHSAIAWHKAQGFYSNGLAPSLRKLVIGDGSFGENLTEKSLWLAGKADDITWGALWNASKLKVEDENKALKKGSDEYWEEVNKVFSDIINNTQVVDTPLTKSTWMRGNGLGVFFTAFMAEPTKTYSMVMTAVEDLVRNPKSKQAQKTVALVGTVFAVNAAVNALAQALADAARDDDKEKSYWEKYVEKYTEDIKDNLNPLTYIPVVKDIFSLWNGYSNNNLAMQAAQNTVYAVQELQKIAKGTSKKTLFGQMETCAKAVSSWTGIPFGNVMRTFNSFGNIVGIDTFRRKKYTKSELGRNVVLSIKEGNTAEATEYWNQLVREVGEDEISEAYGYISTYLAEHDDNVDAYAVAFLEDANNLETQADDLMRKYEYNEYITLDVATDAIRKAARADQKAEAEAKGEKYKQTVSSTNSGGTIYNSSDVNRALERGNIDEAQKVIDKINAGYKTQGSNSTAKSAVSNYWKPKYLSATGAERDRIARMLYKLKNNGKQMFSSKDLQKWVSDANKSNK